MVTLFNNCTDAIRLRKPSISLCLWALCFAFSVYSHGVQAQSQTDTEQLQAPVPETPIANQQPSTPLYQIEMLVYRNKDHETNEQFPVLNNLHYPDQVDRFPSEEDTDPDYIPQDFGEYLLLEDTTEGGLEAIAKLKDNKSYAVIFHKRWQQYVPPQTEERYLLIEGGDAYGAYHELQGVLGLYLGRYLHAQLELWLSDFTRFGKSVQALPPLPPRTEEKDEIQLFATEIGAFRRKARNISDDLNAGQKSGQRLPVAKRVIRLKEIRRMRSKQLHYFDHPVMGVLLYVERVERTE